MRVLLQLVAEPPLNPSPDDASSLLRRELVHPEYHERNILQQILAWIDRFVSGSIDAATQAPPLSTFAAMVAFLLLTAGLVWLLSKARRTARAARVRGAVLTDERITADELRARAERALAEGRNGDAVVDGFRALAVRQVERGRLDDLPGATAHEVAVALATAHPGQRQRVDRSAALFDSVLYGDRPASPGQAAEVLQLDDALVGR
ncbi:MAG: integral rane protein [Frankiales bacterium]|nr:integral rane protein [Frankiales bacterium]